MQLDNSTEVVFVHITLTKEEAQKLQALVAAVSVNTADEFFDEFADKVAQQLQYSVIAYVQDGYGEFGPYVEEQKEESGCGCGSSITSEQDFQVTGYERDYGLSAEALALMRAASEVGY